MRTKFGRPLTALGDGVGLVLEETEIMPIVRPDAPVDFEVKNKIEESLINQLRSDLFYTGNEPEWVALRASLRRFTVKMGTGFMVFPEVLNSLRILGANGFRSLGLGLMDLAEKMPLDGKSMNIFAEKLVKLDAKDQLKNPQAVLQSMQEIAPKNWTESVWYLELMVEVDITMAELTSLYMERFQNKPIIYTYFLMQIARTGRLEALDRYVELLQAMEKAGEDISKGMEPIMEMIRKKRLAEAEMTLGALEEAYGISESLAGEDGSAILFN